MEYVDLTIKQTKTASLKLAKKIETDIGRPDLVIFVAEGAFLIGEAIGKYFGVPLLEIRAARRGGALKKLVSPFISAIPKPVKPLLRRAELRSNVHKSNPERAVSFDHDLWGRYIYAEKILIVDDSVDTGASARCVTDAARSFFIGAGVCFAALNVFSASTFLPDYYLYRDCMLCGPWSSDSREHKEFKALYRRFHVSKEA